MHKKLDQGERSASITWFESLNLMECPRAKERNRDCRLLSSICPVRYVSIPRPNCYTVKSLHIGLVQQSVASVVSCQHKFDVVRRYYYAADKSSFPTSSSLCDRSLFGLDELYLRVSQIKHTPAQLRCYV